MRATKNELVLRRTTKFSKADINSSSVFTEISENSDSIGGVIRKGQLGWLARGPLLEVFSLRNGNKISSYRFDITTSFQRCFITCVSEIEATNLNYCLLAVGVQFGDDPGGMVSIYSVQESKVLRSIETAEKITCCHLINANVAERTGVLEMYQGCLAIGTDVGKIILLDLNLRKCEQTLVETRTSDDDFYLVPCHVVLSTMDADHIRQHFRHSRRENVGFGIQLESVDNPGLVLSLQCLDPLLSIAVGLEDGRLILYDLTDLQAFHLAYPPEDIAPLVKLSYVEPPDDPRACIYIWAFHENRSSSIAVMHSVMYDRKVTDEDDDDGFYVFEGFQSCSVRLTLPMFERGSIPVSCQSVKISPSHDSEETISLCLLAWKSRKTSEILIFDINQWYKEQMPHIGDWRDNLSYLASFPLKECDLLDVWLDGRTVAPFNSIQRPEEHFFPISLSFDCTVFRDKESMKFHWPGLQNRALSMLNMAGPSALLEPSVYYHEAVKASLISLNTSDYSFSSTTSLNTQREILLSVALEYNCFGLLRECAKCWADGSHLGKKPEESLSLSTLTTWIWKRAENIKDRCNILCVPLFDHSGLRIDQRSQIELSYCSRQLKLLADLMHIIITKCSEYIPEEVSTRLSTQYNSIKMASEYQEVLQWFLNVGLLPEAATDYKRASSYLDNPYDTRSPLVPYPYKALRNYYMSQRMKFKKINSGLLSPRTQSCRILYIDSFIEHECNSNALREHWLESGGNGLYPPSSLQAMLRVMLIPDVPIESKYILFVYFFLDLNMSLEDDRYAEIVQNFMKFPSVFKISSSTVKTVQAFWNLDHGQFEASLEDIISPFLHDRKLIQWQKELLIEALLVHHSSKLALRALQAPGPPISSLLELKTLLANDMVAEAFHLQRSKNDADLFRHFLTGCLYLGKLAALLDLALTEDEERILQQFLRDSKSAKTENLHFVHLLQRSKYIEAIQQLDELSSNRHSQHSVDLETPNLVLAAYNTTMTPATKQLSEVYYGIRNRLKAKEPEAQILDTLSSQLLKNNANDLIGGVYHSSIMSVDEATNYWDEEIQRERKRLLYPNNVPFIRRPQLEAFTGYQGDSNICYPETYKGVQKRRLDSSDEVETQIDQDPMENPKKRQRINDSLSGIKTAQPLNASLLTKFKNRQSHRFSVGEENVLSTVNQTRYEKDPSVTSLNTPLVRSSRPTMDSRDDSMSETSELSRPYRVGTPQSILKVRTTASASVTSPLRKAVESTPRRSVSPKDLDANTYMDEEKSIRFDLPSANVTETSSLQTSHDSLEMSQRVPSTSIASAAVDEKGFDEKVRRLEGPSARKGLRSSDASLMSTSGDEEFFSPQHSRDNSIKKEERKKDIDNSESESEKDIEIIVRQIPKGEDHSQSKATTPLGPKPRKPLERSTRSRSKTPDIQNSPVRKSARILDRTKSEITETREMQTVTETIRQTGSKPLSRLVLELNAKKLSSLNPTESSLKPLDKGLVLAQSTQLHEEKITVTKTWSTAEEKSSTIDNDYLTEVSIPSASFHVNETRETIYDSSEMVDEPYSNLSTTVGMSSFELTMEEKGPPSEMDTSKTFKGIGGRRSYKTSIRHTLERTQEKSQESSVSEHRKPLEEDSNEQVSEEYQQNPELRKGESEEKNKSSSNVTQMEIDDVDDEEERKLVTLETEAEDILEGVKEKQDEGEEKSDVDEGDEDQIGMDNEAKTENEDADMESGEHVVVEDEGEEEASEEDEESDGNESKSDDVISISSGNESGQNSAATATSSESRSNTPRGDESEESAASEGDSSYDGKLLYGDLEFERPSSNAESISSTETEPFLPAPSDSELNVQIQKVENTTKSVAIESKSIETVITKETSTVTFTDSSIDNAPPPGMALNVLTGEYENIVDDEEVAEQQDTEDQESEKVETMTTSVKTNVEAAGPVDASVKYSKDTAKNEAEPISAPEVVDKASSNATTSEPAFASDNLRAKNVSNVETENPLKENITVQSEPTPSTSKQKSRSKTSTPSPLKSTEDSQRNVRANGAVQVGRDIQEEDENNAKTPVKTVVEIDSTTDSGRILRSARRRSTSIDNTTEPVIDSPSVAKRILRAKSVPRTESADTPTNTKLRRRSNSTDNPSTPTRILTRRQSTLLDKIEEDSVLDSPRRSTRKRVPAETDLEELPQTPTSMVKRTRKTSNSSADTPSRATTPRSTARKGVLAEDNSQTPQRITRRSSISNDTPKAETKDKKVKSRAKKSNTPEVGHDTTESDESEVLEGDSGDLTKVKGSGVRKLFSKSSTSKGDSMETSEIESSPETREDSAYQASRRLTRHQQSVMEKSAAITKKLEAVPKKVTRRQGSKLEESPTKKEDISETESIISARSKYSTGSGENRRVTRSSALKADVDDDAASVASSTRSGRSTKGNKKAKPTSTKDVNLGTIAEEDQENVKKTYSNDDSDDDAVSTLSAGSKDPSKKKSRGKKTQK